MIFEFGKYKIDVDVEKTRQYYENEEEISCTCDGCQNYLKAVENLPDEIVSVFNNLGIPMKKVARVTVLVATKKESAFYDGFCHICGEIIEVPKDKEKSIDIDELNMSFSDEGGFTTKYEYDNFPRPVIQMDFAFSLPWVLDKENEYFEEYINTINKTTE